MSEENKTETQPSEENAVNNPSTEAKDNNVPYDRFQEVNQTKNDLAGQVGKLQAQIEKMNQNNKDKAQAKLVEDGKLQEALDIVTKERDSYKVKSDEYDTYQTDKRENLMSKLTDDEDKSIAEDLSLGKLETYVNRVTNVNAPSTSQARATSGQAGVMGGYSSWEEFAIKDPKGAEKAIEAETKGFIK